MKEAHRWSTLPRKQATDRRTNKNRRTHDRFARILAISALSDAARLRRLNGNPFGRLPMALATLRSLPRHSNRLFLLEIHDA